MYVGRATRLTRQGSGDQHWNVDQMRGGVFFLVDVGQFCLLCSVGIEVRGGAAGGGRWRRAASQPGSLRVVQAYFMISQMPGSATEAPCASRAGG